MEQNIRKSEREITHLPVAILNVDKRYQRGLSESLVDHIAKNWDPDVCTPLLVCRRDGQFSVADGQHRLEAAKRVGVEYLPCQIVPTHSMAREAQLFHDSNCQSKLPKSVERFHSLWQAGREEVVRLGKVMKAHGIHWRPGERSKANTLRSTSKIRREFSPDELDEVLDFVNKCWPDNGKRLRSYFLTGCRKFRKRLMEDTGRELTSDPVVKRFRETSMKEIDHRKNELKLAHDCGNRKALVKALVDIYNARRREQYTIGTVPA